MQVHTINNIHYKNLSAKQYIKKTKKAQSCVQNVVSYSVDNVNANYMPAFKSTPQERKIHNFLSCIGLIEVNGKSLRDQIKNPSVLESEDFDAVAWGNFCTLFNSKSGNSEKTNIEKFLSKNTFQELLTSPDFNPTDVFETVIKIKDSMPSFDSPEFWEVIGFVSDVDDMDEDAITRVQIIRSAVGLDCPNFISTQKKPEIEHVRQTLKEKFGVDFTEENL